MEGFDDSFDTMKAIAEYFRDLAADDRYFGAEPPTPDADMLARIAEKEIARRVEAHEDAGKIHLRADVPPAIAPAAEPETQDEVTVEEAAPAPAVEDVAEEAPTAVEEAAAEPAVELPEEIEEDEVSADDAVAASVESAMAMDAVEDTAEEAAEDIAELAEAPVDELIAAPEEATDTTDSDDEATLQNILQADLDDTPVEETAPAPATEDEDDDSVAARLRRIRSVVAGGASDFESDAFSEDEHAQDFLNDTVSDLDAALMADAPETEAMPERIISDIVEDGAHDDALDHVAEELGMSQDAAFEDEAEDIQDLAEDTLSQLLADAIPDDADENTAEDRTEGTDADVEPELIQTRPLRARVIKMKRSDFEAAVAEGGLEEAFDVLEDSDDSEPAEAILSPEDEADLQSELDAVSAELEAEVEADLDAEMADSIAADDDASEAMADDDDMDEPAADTRPKSQVLDEDRPISRLFDEAKSHLSTPEANRRRNAIQHLRAAVEANQAETSAGSALRRETDDGAYRSDIADAMRGTGGSDSDGDAQPTEVRMPTRPRARRPADQPTERPAGQRPAPLQLVAEQRVDMPQDPVRPRRVSTVQMSAPVELHGDAGSFRDFAEDLGATELTELLEAAAAYVSDVEGLPQFSRRTLMGKLDEFSSEDFSREDRLKSFGLLLRHGKLQKLKGGQFTVTDDTEYRTAG
ncbi:MAG: hypothetical protein AAFZ04_05055, partial [Pseudomonadota bacterium]